MKLSGADRDELRDDLDELLDAVRELRHELGSDNKEVESGGKCNRKKSRNNGGGHYKKGQANSRRNH